MDKLKMQTIVLCGGFGTRMKEETEYRPKPMVEIGGKPLLWHIMKHYSHFGYNDFLLALGYKGSYIKDFFSKWDWYLTDFALNTRTGKRVFYDPGKIDDFDISFVDTGEETLTGERVLRLRDYIEGDLFMLTYGDGLADVDIDALVSFHLKQGTLATLTGVKLMSRFGLMEVNRNNIVTCFQQKPRLHDFVSGGYMVFKKEFMDYLKPGDIIEDAFLRLVDRGQVSLFPHEGFWFCVDTLRDLQEANRLWNEGGRPWACWERDSRRSQVSGFHEKCIKGDLLKI